jgi:hypothetical protein
VVSRHAVARDTAVAGAVPLIGALAVVFPGIALVQVLASLPECRYPAVAIVAWLGVLSAAPWLVPRLRTGCLTWGETVAAIAIAIAAVAATGAAQPSPPGTLGTIDLAILGTAWLLVLVAMSRPARVWIPGALLVLSVHGMLLIRDSGVTPLSLTEILTAGCVLAAALIASAVSRSTLDMQASLAARAASLASRAVAERSAAAAIGHERRRRLAVLEKEALPLLRCIADGTLDPADEAVREQCARHAALLRRALADGDPGADLMAELEQVLRTSAVRGLQVTVQLIGDPGTPQPPISRAVLDTVEALLSSLPPHQAVLTVLAVGDDVELYLTFGAQPRTVPDLTRFGLDVPAAARWHAAVNMTGAGGGCLEVSWRKDSPATILSRRT